MRIEGVKHNFTHYREGEPDFNCSRSNKNYNYEKCTILVFVTNNCKICEK